MICLMRVDDRLIHGQVQTSWISISEAKNVMVVDNDVRNDDIAKQVLKFALPVGMKLKVCNVDEAVAFWEKAIASPNNIMVLFKTIVTVQELVKKGVKIKELMVGPVSYKEGAIEIIHSTYFTEAEMKAAQALSTQGVSIYFQHTPDQKKEYWKHITI
ncbi:PTS sugar transporter subunit IIB [[Clostridium] innocuum]|nr:PTS sugar transporter subunit IIB [[Clostridium] innocuum]